MRLAKLERILSSDGELQPVLAKARDLHELAGVLGGLLPSELAAQARVANYREGEIVLSAASSAAAAKLKLLAPSLCRLFQSQRWQVRSVGVRVQPNASQTLAVRATQKTAYLSTDTIDNLKALYERMSDSPAREALGRLLERRGAMREKVPRPRRAAAPAPGRKLRT